MLAVTFQFDYVDGNQIGFNDPTLGEGFKSALESAASRLGNQLQHEATIEMKVFSRNFTGSAIAHAASESQPPLPQGGFAAPVIPNKILFGADANGQFADGRLEIFFFDEGDDFVYATDPAEGITGNQLDLQSIIIHELVHAIGFTSATNANGSDDAGRGITSPGTWTLYDQFLSDSDGNRLIDADPQSATAFRMDTSATGWPTDSIGGPGPNDGLFFDGPIASGVYGGRVPLYSPSTYSLSSTASHLDSQGFPGPAIFSPLEHLMSHATVVGVIPQGLTLLEKAILADIGIMFQLDEGYEFGDAANPYPVSLAENGARHFPSDLTLGFAKDYEFDGEPSIDMNQIDDDGVVAISDFVADPDMATIASVSVQSSNAATLDAWIDWNLDGDWQDAGEKIFVNQNVDAGINHLSFTVPPNASPGSTTARYRLSTQRDLLPTGLAADGEVEDFQVTVLDGSLGPAVSVRIVRGTASVSRSNDQLRVASGDLNTFAAPSEDISSIQLIGDAGDDFVTLSLDDPPLPSGGLRLSGSGGQNSLRTMGTEQTLDLTDPSITVSNFQHLDLSHADVNTVALRRTTIETLSPINQTILVSLGEDDRIDVLDAEAWRMADPIVGDAFLLTAINLVGGQTIQVETAFPWQNVLLTADVNSDGTVTASDALRIVNELARRAFSDATTQQLVDPVTLANWPAAYFDHNADNRVTALDALRVINDLSRQSNRGEGEAIFVVSNSNNGDDDIHSPRNDLRVERDPNCHPTITTSTTAKTEPESWRVSQTGRLAGVEANERLTQSRHDQPERCHDSVLADWPSVISSHSKFIGLQ